MNDDDEDVCRICRDSGNNNHPLLQPCTCSGSMKFVHRDCLLRWRNHNKTSICEVCKHEYSLPPETAPSFSGQFVKLMRRMMIMVNVAYFFIIEIGVFPLMCGWWIDICTVRMFGATIAQRIEFFAVSPFRHTYLHWIVGIVYMSEISVFARILRGVLRNGIILFFQGHDRNGNLLLDMIGHPVEKYARRVLFGLAVYGSLAVMLIFLPVKLAMRLAPSIFPLDLTFPCGVIVFDICYFATNRFNLQVTVKVIVHQWFKIVCRALHLTDYLLPGAEDNDGHLRDRQGVDDGHADSEYGFAFRIVLLLVLAWMTLMLFNTALITVPISLGKPLLNAIPRLPMTRGFKDCSDLYAFNTGCYIILAAVAGIRYSVDHIETQRARILMS